MLDTSVPFTNLTVNGQVFDNSSPQAANGSAGGLHPSTLNNGNFSAAQAEN